MNHLRLLALSTLISFYSIHPAAVAPRQINACPIFVAAPATLMISILLSPTPQAIKKAPVYYPKTTSKALVSNNHYSRHQLQASAKNYSTRGNYKHGKSRKG